MTKPRWIWKTAVVEDADLEAYLNDCEETGWLLKRLLFTHTQKNDLTPYIYILAVHRKERAGDP